MQLMEKESHAPYSLEDEMLKFDQYNQILKNIFLKKHSRKHFPSYQKHTKEQSTNLTINKL